tara:strand:- start:204 stop:467 length:264 start_codon:yes stop_codon:yes gene_type:complete
MIIPRGEYDVTRDIAEGDLVEIDWASYNDIRDVGIVLKVALEVRNEDHLCPSEEILVAEVLVGGSVYVFDEEELNIVEKCNNNQPCV